MAGNVGDRVITQLSSAPVMAASREPHYRDYWFPDYPIRSWRAGRRDMARNDGRRARVTNVIAVTRR